MPAVVTGPPMEQQRVEGERGPEVVATAMGFTALTARLERARFVLGVSPAARQEVRDPCGAFCRARRGQLGTSGDDSRTVLESARCYRLTVRLAG